MAVTPAMPAMADQSTVSDYVEATADNVSDYTSDDTTIAPAPLPEPTVKSGWETVDGVNYYYENGEKVVNKAKKIGKYTYCFDKNVKNLTLKLTIRLKRMARQLNYQQLKQWRQSDL